MNKSLVVFILDEQRYALDLSMVERVVRVVEVIPLPKTSEFILGVINLQGQIIPVVNVRKWLCLPEREVNLSDQLIIIHPSSQRIALMVDTVRGVIENPEQEVITTEEILPGMEYVKGMVKLEDGMAIILHNLDKLLSLYFPPPPEILGREGK
ncbi:MAG TPA: chemotaxis protein CheW [Candidatus Limnocylindrales bacterium]|nr:chemotaxis protein CheW [Candidatus Limnocylindrales bacterium]